MEILVKGHNTIKLTSHGEEYTIQRPSSFVYVSLLPVPQARTHNFDEIAATC